MGVALGALLAFVAVMAVLHRYGTLSVSIPAKAERPAVPELPVEAEPSPSPSSYDDELLRRRVGELEERFEYGFPGSGAEILQDELFRAAVGELAIRKPAMEDLVRLARENRVWVSKIALAVMADRDDVPEKWRSAAVRRLESAAYDHAGLMLFSLERVRGHVIGSALAKADQVITSDLVRLLSADRERP